MLFHFLDMLLTLSILRVIFLYNITPETHIRSQEKRETSPTKEALEFVFNTPCQLDVVLILYGEILSF